MSVLYFGLFINVFVLKTKSKKERMHALKKEKKKEKENCQPVN
jgi:hypothetical protein